MIWVGWRQQRLEALIVAAMLAALAAVAIPVGIHAASVYSHDDLSVCARSANGLACNLSVSSFLVRFTGLNVLFTWSTLVPALAALLFAAPFILDLDGGTYRLYWTQSITRRRWIVVKLGLAVLASVAVAGVLIGLAMWSRAPIDALSGRMGANAYDSEGIVPVAYALFVLGVGVALGALWRRTVPALLSAFVVYVVVRAFVDSWLRQRLLTPITTTWPGSRPGPNLNGALVINQFASDKHGNPLAVSQVCTQGSGPLFTHAQACRVQPSTPGVHVFMTAIYQPANRFWDLQGIEFGIVAGVGVLLILAAAWWTDRRIS